MDSLRLQQKAVDEVQVKQLYPPYHFEPVNNASISHLSQTL